MGSFSRLTQQDSCSKWILRGGRRKPKVGPPPAGDFGKLEDSQVKMLVAVTVPGAGAPSLTEEVGPALTS